MPAKPKSETVYCSLNQIVAEESLTKPPMAKLVPAPIASAAATSVALGVNCRGRSNAGKSHQRCQKVSKATLFLESLRLL